MLRQGGAARDRIDALHARVLELQKSSVDELHGFSVEQDASQHVQRALAAIDGKPMRDAILGFALMRKAPAMADLISAFNERAKNEVLGSVMPMDIINARGQVVAKLPPLEPASTGNLRNETSHGLLTDEGCYSTQSLYAWWLLLRYALLPGLLP